MESASVSEYAVTSGRQLRGGRSREEEGVAADQRSGNGLIDGEEEIAGTGEMVPTIVKRLSRLWNLGHLICARSNSLRDDQRDVGDGRLEGGLRGWKTNDAFLDSCFSKDDNHKLTRRSSWKSLRRSLSDDLQLLTDSLEMSDESSDGNDKEEEEESRDHYVPLHCAPNGDGDADGNEDAYKAESGLESLPDNLLVFIFRNIVGDTPTLFRCMAVSRRFRRLVPLALKDMHHLAFANLAGDDVARALSWTRHLRRLSLKYETNLDVIAPKSVLPDFQIIWRQSGSADLSPSFLKERGIAEQDESTPTLTFDSLQLWLSGPATWKFYQSVAALAMAYVKMVKTSGKQVMTFSLRIGSGDPAPALEQQRPADWATFQTQKRMCGATKPPKTQGVSWIGFVCVGPQAASNRAGFEAASRDLKLLMAPRLFKLACLHRSSARNRRWVAPPVVFDIEFVHAASLTPIQQDPARAAPEKNTDNSDYDNDSKSGSRVDNEDKGEAFLASDELTKDLCRPCGRCQKSEEEEGSCSVRDRPTDITDSLICLLAQIIDEHPGE
ncbi:hypothetical protein CBR_g2808 [Chara braunii]|uniref:F-box domain-containing protein n=1 Tax=Chara braunii TaxID=69332 RepID=A0A388KE27_CHABU|nr:hypothetical protein CBR_g2808 [Chara braunii]|eukprot:GBG68257.1 hypothetical protein CBR_g2808 [Chara braunii]